MKGWWQSTEVTEPSTIQWKNGQIRVRLDSRNHWEYGRCGINDAVKVGYKMINKLKEEEMRREILSSVRNYPWLDSYY